MFVINKRGAEGVLFRNVVYLIFVLIFAAAMVFFVSGNDRRVVVSEDFYAKEIAMMVNLADAGNEFWFDVTKMSGVAVDNGKSPEKMIWFDNENQEVIVSLRPGGGTSFPFVNDVAVADWKVEFNTPFADKNQFYFKVIDAKETEEEKS